MRILVTGFDHEKKIQAIKGIRSVARQIELKTARDFIDGPLPEILECNSALTWPAIQGALEQHGVEARCADENATLLEFLAALPTEMSVGQLCATLNALSSFQLPVLPH